MSKATGIVRRVDDLGRVLIPKEIRRTLRIRESDPMEIFMTDDGHGIEFRPYTAAHSITDDLSVLQEGLNATARDNHLDARFLFLGRDGQKLLRTNLIQLDAAESDAVCSFWYESGDVAFNDGWDFLSMIFRIRHDGETIAILYVRFHDEARRHELELMAKTVVNTVIGKMSI